MATDRSYAPQVRPHFTEWAANTSNPKLNIGKEMLPMTARFSASPRVRCRAGASARAGRARVTLHRWHVAHNSARAVCFQEWAEFKYTAHVDGITCSSKLQKARPGRRLSDLLSKFTSCGTQGGSLRGSRRFVHTCSPPPPRPAPTGFSSREPRFQGGKRLPPVLRAHAAAVRSLRAVLGGEAAGARPGELTARPWWWRKRSLTFGDG